MRPRPPQVEKKEPVKVVEPPKEEIKEEIKEKVVEPEPVVVAAPEPEKTRYYSDAPLLTLVNAPNRFVYHATDGQNRKVLMPLRKVSAQSEISGATVWTTVELYYHNPSRDQVLRNSSFSFPVDHDKDTSPILTKFESLVDEDEITEIKTEIK